MVAFQFLSCVYVSIKTLKTNPDFVFSNNFHSSPANPVTELKTLSANLHNSFLVFYCNSLTSWKIKTSGPMSERERVCVCLWVKNKNKKKIHAGYRSVIVRPWNSWKHGNNFLPNLGRLECIPKIQTEIVKFKNFLLVPNPAAPGRPNCLQPGHYSKAWSLATNSTY